jgi:hypothetical protein
MAIRMPRAMKLATIAEPPKLRNGVTTPVRGTRPRMPAAMMITGNVRNSVTTVARKNP